MAHVRRQSMASLFCIQNLAIPADSLLCSAEFRGPGVRQSYDESGDDYELDLDQRTRNMGGRSGKIILLGDGTEMLTDSDDTEMFDHSEEDRDLDSQVNKSQANTSDAHRENQPTTNSGETSTKSNPSDMEKTKSPQSYLNHTPEVVLPTKLENPPKDQ